MKRKARMAKNGLEWARNFMKFSMLGSTRDVISVILGLISMISWGIAQFPQIHSNFKRKSTDGLSILFVFSWILGDLLNIFGCLLEPFTLPTQFYVAIVYVFTSSILAGQVIWYTYFHTRENSDEQQNEEVISTAAAEEFPEEGFSASASSSIPIPFPSRSARDLPRNHNSSAGSYVQQRMTPDNDSNSITMPLLDRDVSTVLSPSPGIKRSFCLVFYLSFFLGICNFRKSVSTGVVKVFQAPISIGKKVGRKLLQANGVPLKIASPMDGLSFGFILGWGMTIIYISGRLPQIYRNCKQRHVKGLSPLMFVFALLANITYMASILFKSTAWSQLRPNLPWLVDAGGCLFLDIIIVIQFIHFRRFPVPQTDEIVGS